MSSILVQSTRILILALLLIPIASADSGEPSGETSGEPHSSQPTENIEEKVSTARGEVTIAGQKIAYTATVGDLIVQDDDGQGEAKMTFIAYVRDGAADRAARPVTFAFNGGPGSASVWVHLGAFGPKKALLDAEGMPLGPPPGKLVDNPDSLLDVTDLVFIDPVETGWSRPLPGEDKAQFLGYSDDVRHIGEFIRIWLSRNGRWASPKFIAGESYGTTRAAGLAQYLQDRHGMYLNGICLISSVIHWQTKVFNIGNDLPFPLILPTYTATAWYHGLLGDRYSDLQAALRDAEDFALGEYASALMLGDRLEGDRRARIRQRLAELTGLDEDYLEAADLRVEIYRFAKEVLRHKELTVGRLDSRYTGRDIDSAGESFEFDPSGAVVNAYYVSLLKDYLRRDLGYETDLAYRHSAWQYVRPWNYHEKDRNDGYNTNAYANYAETLRQAMHKNPYLNVLVMSGYYDLATPYFATDYTFDHLRLAPELRENVRIEYYEAGHMMYVRAADARKFRADYASWIEEALARRSPPAP